MMKWLQNKYPKAYEIIFEWSFTIAMYVYFYVLFRGIAAIFS